ncbi:MAG TPA: AAA family ATPase, partial [Thermomicrobiales bacterium]|nr:AAA family ATPase [Thermomicrobiales bacterium]
MDTPLAPVEVPGPLRLYVLGGFRAERAGRLVPDAAWQRRSAKALVKLLAIAPDHRLHREQLLDLLWPDRDPDSAANGFRKALHLARHALEPTLAARGTSAYLRLADDLLFLVGEAVWVDADQFQALAARAFTARDRASYEAALAAGAGELLPEDRYADWAEPRRAALSEQRQRLLLELAALLEREGDCAGAAERLRLALAAEPTREEAHRQLMRVYALGGSRHQALRQYQICRDILRRELDTAPDRPTEALYQDLLAGRPAAAGQPRGDAGRPVLPAAVRQPPPDPLVGRERALATLLGYLAEAVAGTGTVVLVGGEAGVGKSRLVGEVAREAARRGARVLWGASYEQEGRLPYGPFVEAIEGYLADQPAAERSRFAATYPELTALVPTLAPAGAPTPPVADLETERTRLFAAVARWCAALGAAQPLALVLDDLHHADAASVQLLHYLARAAPGRRWLLLGAYREEDLVHGSAFQQLCATATRAGLCRRLDLLRLTRQDCDRLIQALLPGGAAAPALLEHLYALSQGNPLFAQELVRAMQAHGDLLLRDGRWLAADAPATSVPRQVRDLVEGRIERLGEDTRRVLGLAAVGGMQVAFPVLRAAGGLADGPLLDALDRALAAQILEERGDGYAFRHPLFRATLYDRLSRPRRARLHALLGEALERQADVEQPEAVEALAHHWAEAGEPARAVPYLIR